MKPAIGVGLELVALVAALLAGLFIPTGLSFTVFVVIAELLATYLVHCPAHFLVGTALGIRFRRIGVTRSTLARSLPSGLGPLIHLFVVPTLSTDRGSMVVTSPSRATAMYASGTVASVASALAIASVVTAKAPLLTSIIAWTVALGYLLFDVVFSPRSGDLKRARDARNRS